GRSGGLGRKLCAHRNRVGGYVRSSHHGPRNARRTRSRDRRKNKSLGYSPPNFGRNFRRGATHMSHTVDLTLFRRGAHNPSYFSLLRSGRGQQDIVDFCVPCNPYFPTAAMFADLSANLETILKYYPSDSEALIQELASLLALDPDTIALANGSTELIT